VAVAVVLALVAALMGRCADHRARLGLDELLEDKLDARPDQVDVISGTERVEQCVGVKLLVGHRW